MLRLEEAQANFIATINEGPYVLDAALFSGPVERVLLGLIAHANTISHARLVALEETFPLTRQELGETRFNELSRDYVEAIMVRRACSNQIGRYFQDFLQVRAVDEAIINLASIEWAWLESYHAADAAPLAATDLAGLDEDVLLELAVAAHPSLRLVVVTAPLASALDELAGQRPAAIATIRPEAHVRLLALDGLEYALAKHLAEKKCTLGNLIGLSLEWHDEQAPLEPTLHLISAGALVKAGQS